MIYKIRTLDLNRECCAKELVQVFQFDLPVPRLLEIARLMGGAEGEHLRQIHATLMCWSIDLLIWIRKMKNSPVARAHWMALWLKLKEPWRASLCTDKRENGSGSRESWKFHIERGLRNKNRRNDGYRKRSMLNSQTALQTVSHNIANKSTEGYSTKSWVADQSPSQKDDCKRNGKRASAVSRTNNPLFGKQLQKETQSLGFANGKTDALSRVEQIFNEQANKGLNNYMTDFTFREL